MLSVSLTLGSLTAKADDCQDALNAADLVIQHQDTAIRLFQDKSIELLDENASLDKQLQQLQEQESARKYNTVTYSVLGFAAGIALGALVGR